MSIFVNVVNQKMYVSSTMEGIVAGSQQFVKFRFNLSDEWDGLLTFAQFRQNGVAYNQYLDEENAAYLPAEIGVGTCTLMLYGSHDKTIGTTNYLTLKIDENILVSDASSTDISESLYNQLVTKVNTSVQDLTAQIGDKASQTDLVNEITRAKAKEDDNTAQILLKANQSQVDELELKVSELTNSEVIKDLIGTAVEKEMAEYLASGLLANLAIEDGSVTKEKVSDDIAQSLDKADVAEDISNKTTSISEESTDTQYPSAKAVYDLFLPKRQTIVVDTPVWDIQPIIQPGTLPFMVISIDSYTTSGGPARLYIENRVDLTQVQVGDKLYWWGDASNDPTVEGLRNNVFDTVKTVAVDGSNITITTNGGSAFTSSNITYADIKFAGNATLLSDFDTWKNAAYYITLKDTDGTALSDGQFKLCTAYDGYANAIDQIFTISGKTVSENMAVDFKTISTDRTSFEMRDAGVKNIMNIQTKNNKSQRYVFSIFHSYMAANAPGAKYLYLQDDIGKALRGSASYYTSIGKYGGTAGFLLPIIDSKVGSFSKIGYTITMNRTHVGMNVSLNALRVYDNQRITYDTNGYSDCSAGTEDFSNMELNQFNFDSNNSYYFRNGTSITLEEFA